MGHAKRYHLMNQVIVIPKQISWTTLIGDLEVGQELKAFYSERSTIASRISREIKWQYPERKYPTSKLVEQDHLTGELVEYLIVKREL